MRKIVKNAQDFRESMRPHVNPLMSNPDEISTQRFYLRKIEGADLLLAYETNFLRQQLHKWAPVAPDPPPVLDMSPSTRKPRPTKQQKLMAQYNVDKPEDLPPHLQPRSTLALKRKSEGDHVKQRTPSQPGRSSLTAPNRSNTPASLPHIKSTGNAPAFAARQVDRAIYERCDRDPTYGYTLGDPDPYRNPPTFTPHNNLFSNGPTTLGSPQHYPDEGGASPTNNIDLHHEVFVSPPFARAPGSPRNDHDPYASHSSGVGAGNLDSMFAEMTNHDDHTSLAQEALAAAASQSINAGLYGDDREDVDDKALADEFLNS